MNVRVCAQCYPFLKEEQSRQPYQSWEYRICEVCGLKATIWRVKLRHIPFKLLMRIAINKAAADGRLDTPRDTGVEGTP